MDPSGYGRQDGSEVPRFLEFPHLPDDAKTADGKARLNRFSSTLTNDHDFPGAQVGARPKPKWNGTESKN